jgi:hypothetical protein
MNIAGSYFKEPYFKHEEVAFVFRLLEIKFLNRSFNQIIAAFFTRQLKITRKNVSPKED